MKSSAQDTCNMNISPRTQSLIALHFTIFLWGFTAILGKLISYGSVMLVWHRMVITFVVYLLFPAVWKALGNLSFYYFAVYFGIGALVTSHWLLFYGSIKLGDSASVTLACMGATSFFSSIFEPILLHLPFSIRDFILGVIVIFGVLIINFSLPHESLEGGLSYRYAVITGLAAALFGSMFTILNKMFIKEASPLAISTIEMGAGAFILSILTPLLYGPDTHWYPTCDWNNMSLTNIRSGAWDLVWVLIMSILCTNLTFYLSTSSLHHISAFTVNLSVNLEPVYGIILGALIFHENNDLGYSFYFGTSIILFAIFLSPVLQLLCPVIAHDAELHLETTQQSSSLLIKVKRIGNLFISFLNSTFKLQNSNDSFSSDMALVTLDGNQVYTQVTTVEETLSDEASYT